MLIVESNPAGRSALLLVRYLALVQIPLNGAFPSPAPCSALCQVLATTICISLLPFFRSRFGTYTS